MESIRFLCITFNGTDFTGNTFAMYRRDIGLWEELERVGCCYILRISGYTRELHNVVLYLRE